MEVTEAFPQVKMGFDLGFFKKSIPPCWWRKDWEGEGSRTGISAGTRWDLTAL